MKNIIIFQLRIPNKNDKKPNVKQPSQRNESKVAKKTVRSDISIESERSKLSKNNNIESEETPFGSQVRTSFRKTANLLHCQNGKKCQLFWNI